MKIIAAVLLIACIGIAACSATETAKEPLWDDSMTTTSPGSLPTTRPADFGFVVRYGFDMRNVLDTFNGTFTKDLFAAGTAMTSLRLTDEEMDAIYQQIVDIGLVGYPPNLNAAMPRTAGPTAYKSPHQSYSMCLVAGGRWFLVSWIDSGDIRSLEASLFIALIDQINAIVEQKAEIQVLPKPSGGVI